MIPNKDPPEDYRGFTPSLVCPRCGKPAVAVEYDGKTSMARVLHVGHRRRSWHVVRVMGGKAI